MASRVGAKPHEFNVLSMWANDKIPRTIEQALLAVIMARASRYSKFLVLGMSAWRKSSNRQNFAMQGEKGGDFSAKRFEKYYPYLAWRKAIYFRRGVQMKKSIEERLLEFAMLDRRSKRKIRKLKSDGFGNVLLDPNNESDREWYENDEDYDFDLK